MLYCFAGVVGQEKGTRHQILLGTSGRTWEVVRRARSRLPSLVPPLPCHLMSLTTSDLTSSFVGFQVETIARKVDETWSKLSEDSINEKLAISSLPAMLVYSAQAPSSRQPIDFTALSRNKLLLAIFAGGLVLSCGICSFLSFILMQVQKVSVCSVLSTCQHLG